MVAVITGGGLGLGNTSLTQLGQAQGGAASLGQGGDAAYVNAATGNLVLNGVSEGLVFDGLSLNLVRTYNSFGQASASGHWSYGFHRSLGGLTGSLNTAGSTITRTADDGSTEVFTYDSNRGLYVASGQSGARDTLSWNAGTSTWTYIDRASEQPETYDASGRLSTIGTPLGMVFTLSYNGSGQLVQITDGAGDRMVLGYNGAGQLTSLTDLSASNATLGQVSYGYDASGRLTSVSTSLVSDTSTATGSYSTTYTYDGASDRIASVTQSDGTTVSYGYTQDAAGDFQVTTITTGTGAAAQTVSLSYASGSTTVTDALGQATTYQFDAGGRLTAVIAAPVGGSRPTTHYTYDADGNVLTRTDPDGAVTQYSYDAQGNLVSVVDALGDTVTYGYDAEDRRTSQTTYTVPAQGTPGQSGYVAPGGAQTTYYVYDTGFAVAQLAYVIDPLGQVTEYDTGTQLSNTVLTSVKQYVGVPYDASGASASQPPTLAQLQAWVASAPVQATLGRMQRVDYQYDARGTLAQRIAWSTLDAQGQGTISGDGGATVTRYTYDAQGRLLQTGTARGSDRSTLETTSYTYDGLGRLLSSTDPLGNVTTYGYADATGTQVITYANGLVTTQVTTSAGLLLSRTQSGAGQASRTTRYIYDAAGQLRTVTDPSGAVTYSFYDADGRVAGLVDALGAVTAYTYDADGRVIATTAYATAVDITGWPGSLPATLPVPTASPDDRTTHTVYDSAGRVIATVDATGAVVTITYDGTGQVTSRRAYAQLLTGAALSTYLASPLSAHLTASASDRVTQAFYDADGQVLATIDADGYVQRTIYDSAGRAVQSIAYATAVSGSFASDAALMAAVTTSAQDQTNRTYYDAAGTAVAQIDGDGYLTTVGYDETTHTRTTTRYATALTAAQQSALTGAESNAALVALLGSTPASQVSTCVYDAQGRKLTETAADGTVTQYQYDAVGQLTQTVVTPVSGQGAARTASATYDAFGDVLTQTDATGATTTYAYNTLGQRTRATDALGHTVYSYYDADGRLAYTVQGQPVGGVPNARGALTAYTYNVFGQVSATRQLAAWVTLTATGTSSGSTLNVSTATLADVAVAAAALGNPAQDRLVTTTYTLAGQIASRIDGRGYQIADQYDAFGDITQVQQQLSQPGSALSTTNSTTTAFAYDARGQRISQVDGVGSSVARTESMQYDAFGRVVQQIDGNGHAITYAYDPLGRQVSSSQVVQGATRTIQSTYDAFDRVLTQTDALGQTTRYQYDIDHHRVTVTSPDGVVTVSTQDAYGDTVAVTDAQGHTLTSTYDGDGRVLTVTDALGHVTTNQYDAVGDLLQVTDAAGQVVGYTYDAAGHVLTRTVDPSGLSRVTTYVYDALGRTIGVTDPTGMVTTMQYDNDGDLLQEVVDAGGLNRITTYTYNGDGKALTVTVGSGAAVQSTQWIYDALGRLSQQIVDPSGLALTTRYAYDANDNLVSVTDANGNVSRTLYDEANEKRYSVDATGAVTQYSYDADGRLTLTRGYATRLSASQMSTLASTPSVATMAGFALPTSGQDSYRQQVYNADGQVIYQLNGTALNVTQYTYDAAGQVTRTTVYATALGVALSPTATVADVAARVQASGQDMTATTAYDADGQAVYQIDGVGDVTQAVYDADGRVVRTIAYALPLSAAALSQLGSQPTAAAVAAAITPNAGDRRTTTVYDTAGQAVLTLDATGAAVARTYDADGRVTSVHAYAQAVSLSALAALGDTPTAAQVGALLSASAADPVSYTVYDAAGEPRFTIDALGNVTETRYDAAGRVIETLAYPQAIDVSAQVTALQQGTALGWLAGQVGGASGANADSAAQATLRLYDSSGRVRFLVRQNAGGTQGTVSEQRYDANGNAVAQIAYGQLLSLQAGTPLSAQLTTEGVAATLAQAPQQSTRTVYDADNRAIYTVDAAGDVTQVSYDAFGRVMQTTRYAQPIVPPASLDAASVAAAVQAAGGSAGARLSTVTYDSRGDVLTTGDALGVHTTYTYDGRGLKTAMSNRDGASWLYRYDAAGRLVQTQSPAVTVGSYDASTGAFSATANQFLFTTTTYDAFGEAGIVTQSWGSNAASVTQATRVSYGYDADGRVITTVNALNVATHVTYNALGEAVVSQDGNGNYSYQVYDRGGQVAYSVDGAGDVTAFTYDAYGHRTGVTAYATPLQTAAIAGWTPGQPLSAAQLQQGLVASASDRVTTVSYDALNRVTQTQQSAISYTASMGALAGTVATGAPTTTYTYDAYGNRISQSVLIQGALTVGSTSTAAVWATTYSYYDVLDRVTMTVTPAGDASAPQGYVTTTAYNAFGDVSQVLQYARAISTAGLSATTPPALPSLGDNVIGFDRTTQYTYDAIGRVLSRTDLGAAMYTGGTPGLLNGSTASYAENNASSVTSYTYDGEGRVLTQTVNGATTTTTYDALGRVLTVTAPARQVLVDNWQTLLQQNPTWDLTTAALFTTVSPVTTYVYDALGDALSTHVAGGGQSTQTWSYYDALGRPVEQIDATAIGYFTDYDGNGNITAQRYGLTTETAAVTVTTTATYDGANRRTSLVVQRDGTSTPDAASYVQYNAFGEVAAQGDHAGTYAAISTHDNAGNLTSAPSSNGAMHTYGYDLAGRRVTDSSVVTGGNGTAVVQDVLNLAGQAVREVRPSSTAASGSSATASTYTYDRWGHVLSQVDANGNRTTFAYDSQDHLVMESEAAVTVVSETGLYSTQNPFKQWFYNIDGELMLTRDEDAHLTSYTYDTVGNLRYQQDGTGANTYTAYDGLGRAVAQQTPGVQEVAGTVAPIHFTAYDGLGRITAQGDFTQSAPGAARSLAVQGTYLLNSNGDRLQSKDALGNVTHDTYDSQHRVLTSTTPLAQTTTYTYDVNGHLVHQVSAAGRTQSWTYNYFGQLLTHTDESGATYTYTYDSHSGLLASETSNWTATGTPGAVTSTLAFQYEADGQIAQLTETVGGATSTYTYQYDANGNQVHETDSTQDGAGTAVSTQTLMSYDSHNRLQVVTQEKGDGSAAIMRTAYVYDAVGNRRAVFARSAYNTDGTPAAAIPLGNGGPTVSAGLAAQTVQPGSALNYGVPLTNFVDNLGLGLTYTATGLPSWMSFNATTGALTGTPPSNAASYTVTITATDALGRSVSSQITVTVPLVAPSFNGATIANPSLQYNTAFSITAPAATDANGLPVTYSGAYYNGSTWVALPSWISFNASTRTFSGTPPLNGGAGSAGTYTLAIIATASGNPQTSAITFNITVPPVATPQFPAGPGTENVQVSSSFSFTV
ncbi:putative Ig domain-containing protein, partial [Dyella sp.]|uniref:putative Ig domain-containing protein n=1 Tax=Dyella sp. TaxID=1869338 RepID=UPI002ED1E48D